MIAAPACGKKADDVGTAVVAGAPAGTVIAIDGKVTAGARVLAKGDAIAADDAIETGDHAHVTIQLAHNHAQWTLGSNKRGVAREAKAWAMASVEGSAAGVTDTATSAGRNGERSAADTDITTSAAAPPTAQPPPPPQAPMAPARTTAAVRPAAPGAPMDNSARREQEEVVSPDVHARQILVGDAGIAACVKEKAHLVVTCKQDAGCALTRSDASADAACLRARLAKLTLPRADYVLELDLTPRAR